MSDVFLSYSKTDLERAGSIVAAIEAEGFSVWWDYDLNPGQKFDAIIGEALRAAKAVVVLWSSSSISSAWVREEASEGLSRGVLIPVLIDSVEIPLGFRQLQHANGASRASLFIAHASADKPRLRGLVKVLIEAGFPLWIDKPHQIGLPAELEKRIGRIRMGSDWQASIADAVRRSRAVLACWSNDAIDGKREQFHYEVFQGMAQQKLNQIKLDAMPDDKIGRPYTFMQIADLSDFREGEFHPELDILMSDMVQKHRAWFFW